MSRAFKRSGAVLAALSLCLCALASTFGTPQPQEYELPARSDVELSSLRYTKPEAEIEPVVSPVTIEGFDKMLGNDTLSLWFHESTGNLRIVDERSGYVWGCVNVEQPDELNKSWHSFANSLVAIDYYDEKDSEKRTGSTDKEVQSSYQWHHDGLTAHISFTAIEISLVLRLRLEGNCIHLSIDPDSIYESGKTKLKSVYMLPFFGAVREDTVSGYMLIPDGPGALIRYAPSIRYTSTYNKRIYGLDMGIDTLSIPSGLQASRGDDYLVEEPQITLPVFGVVHGAYQNAFYAEVTGGVEFASIQAYAAGMITDFNWVTARFDLRQNYVKPVNRADAGIYIPQEERNDVSPSICYTFLTGEEADYSGMAVSYREELLARGVLGNPVDQSAEIPLYLTVVGSEVRDGFLWDSTQTLTTFRQAADMVEDLLSEGVGNMTVVYQGWQKGGVSRHTLGNTSLQGSLGSLGELQALRDTVEQSGSFYLWANIVAGHDPQVSQRSQVTVNRSRAYTHFTRNNPLLMYKDRWLVRPTVSAQLLTQVLQKMPGFNWSLPDYGTYLYSDYARNAELTRSESLALQIESISNAPAAIALTNPNLYMWPHIDVMLHVPVVSGQYLYTTDTIPFLPIVLSGYFEAYAPPINQGMYAPNSILRLVEYGLYPSFTVIDADNQALMNTPLMDLFSIHYGDWRDRIVSTYNTMCEPLTHIRGRRIIGHRVLAEGLVRVRYSEGATIYVNYNTHDCTVDELIIPAGGVIVA